ncbi:zf-HC2 domain-containing protein [Porticoccus sp. W117]|uniref:anti-sigma factor family protein n=1 Tax=Porticoccus sp. W117 TaxID=3054777 RepID=UPI002595B82F|nr:zf-HC2 domain-containing protein [Porticoccus sp. W117]MDM3870259.1 zf-HC2 domain-containing protein [Porticoccus sp. W117]
MRSDELRPLYHDQCQALLPSFINGQLDAGQQRQVQEHVAQCEACFAELQQAQQVVDAIRSEPAELEALLATERMEANLEKTLQAMEGQSPQDTHGGKVTWLSSWRRQWASTPGVSKTVVWAQAACLVLVVGFLMVLPAQQPAQQQGVTLETYSSDDSLVRSAAEHSQVYRVIFQPAATEMNIRTLLNTVDAQIISGPSNAGLYTISTLKPSAQQELILQNLRGSPWVKLAEPSVHSLKASQQDVQQ